MSHEGITYIAKVTGAHSALYMYSTQETFGSLIGNLVLYQSSRIYHEIEVSYTGLARVLIFPYHSIDHICFVMITFIGDRA